MTRITLPCADGTDPNCDRLLDFHIPLKNLTSEQLWEIEQGQGEATIEISQEQVISSGLSERDIERCPTEGRIFMDIYLDSTCAHCGSDQ